jgi:radical SAM family uncharacterized protein/radical SAM-linked protein
VTELFDHPYAPFLSKVEKPNRYTGSEHGVKRKDWSAVKARVCLAFPDIYDIGMSHLGYRILYGLLNGHPDLLAERCYTPWVDMQSELREHGLLLASLESVRPLSDFDVVGFSLQFELTYTNILSMLDLGGIPLRSAARSDQDPLVIAGGPVATHAEPMAPFIDAFLIGDGEEAAVEMALSWAESKGLPRSERLLRLSRIAGVYVPSLYDTAIDPDSGFLVVTGPKFPGVPFPIERRLVRDLSKFPFPDDSPVGGPEAIFDRMSIEVARGCTEGCRFCQAGMIYRPVRERAPEEVVDTVMRALEKSGQDEVSLTALSTADVSCISPLIKKLVEKTAPERVSLSVASLRAYGLAEELLEDMRKVRVSGLTFAPEAGTQRMRDVINKNVTEEQLLETAERVFSRGFDKMKLYFILGLPTETDEDVLGIADVGRNALAVGKRVGKRPSVTVSVSVHVPKPHTPFQWCAMDPIGEVRRKQALLKDAVRRVKGLNLRMHESVTSVLEGVLARGDRRLADVIERAFRNGAHFDSWDERVRIDCWQEALAHYRIDTEPFLDTIPVTARIPWDHIDVGLEDGFLAREYRKALQSRLSPPCGKAKGMFVHHTNVQEASADERKLVCYDCGVACDLGKMREGRIDQLGNMGALEPSAPRRLPLVDARAAKENPELLRPTRVGGPAERFRVRYAKTGPSALLGHLDFSRELPRIVRRAGVRTAYSEGFHPKPEMSFGPALSLGVVSVGEYVDLKLMDAPASEAELLERLNRSASGGISFSGLVRLGPQDPGLSKVLDGARYVLGIAQSAAARFGGEAGLRERVAEFVAKSEVVVLRPAKEGKGIGRKIDVKQHVTSLRVGDAENVAELRQAGIVGRLVPLEMVLPVGNDGSVRLTEVLEAVLGEPDVPFTGLRAALLAGGHDPLELGRHRKAQPEPGASPVMEAL